jgi:hypothetical protein
MSSFYRSRLARELAAILRQHRLPARAPVAKPEPIRDDLEYFADRHSKQMRMADHAETSAAREAHLRMAWLYRAKAAEALRSAMRHNRDALHLSMMDLPPARNHELEALLNLDNSLVPLKTSSVDRI